MNRVIFEESERTITPGDPPDQTLPIFLKRSECRCRSRTQSQYAFRAGCCTSPGRPAKCRQNSAVAEDFIQWLYTAGRDIGFGLSDKIIQSSCFDVLFDLSVPSTNALTLQRRTELPTSQLPSTVSLL